MNKVKAIFLFILTSLFSLLTCHAQYDAKAEELLNAISKKYGAYKTYKADFVYELENPQAKVNEKFSGEINVKGNKFVLKLGSQEVINNGTTVWTYLKEENEVNVSDYTPDEDEITPTKIYSMHKQGFKYMMVEDEKLKGVLYQVVELVPENKKKPYFKIRLWVSKKEKTIAGWKIFEKNGNRYMYTVSNFLPNVKIDDNVFTFDKTKYKDVSVVDLR